MVDNIINSNLREQAGSDSYNRFEYQVYWIVYHMIKEFKNNSDFYIFCEFHDDMAKMPLSDNPKCAEFFQVKTTKQFKTWTFKRLFKTTKKNSGEIKKSFLGFIFYNFLKFKNECEKCHFVSNKGMDIKVLQWQAIIEDGKVLSKENPALFHEIKAYLKKEYEELEEDEFDFVFEKFIQNTHLYNGELSLDNYEKVVAGDFFKALENENISTANSNKILRDIIEDVRKKSKTKIQMPISYSSLKEKKGISSEVFSMVKEQVDRIDKTEKKYIKIEKTLEEEGLKIFKINLLIRELKKHDRKLLDTSNRLLIESTDDLFEKIDELLIKNFNKIDDFNYLRSQVLTDLLIQYKDVINKEIAIDEVLVEALFYERLLS